MLRGVRRIDVRRLATAAKSSISTEIAPVSTSSVPEFVPEWLPKHAVAEKQNSLFSLASTIPSFAIPNSTVSTSKAIASSLAPTEFWNTVSETVLLRQSWLEFLGHVNGEMKKDGSDLKICLDARDGAGKSTFLTHASVHFRELGYIVVHLPNLSSWVAGLEPYAKPTDSQYFTQAEFTSTVLAQILKVNKEALAKIEVEGKYVLIDGEEFEGTLAEMVALGTKTHAVSHSVLNAFMKELFQFPKNRPPVLFSIDQVNALYTKTAYCDVEGNTILSDQMALLRVFIDLLAMPSIPKACVICATDRKTNQIASPYLMHILSRSPTLNTNSTFGDAFTESSIVSSTTEPFVARKHIPNPDNLSEFSTHGHALVNKKAAPALYDPFTFKSAEVHPSGLAVYSVPRLLADEGYQLLEWFRRMSGASAGKRGVNTAVRVTDEFVRKGMMVSDGYVGPFLKYCLSK